MEKELLEGQEDLNSESTIDSDKGQNDSELDTSSDKKKKSTTRGYIQSLKDKNADLLKRLREYEDKEMWDFDIEDEEEEVKPSKQSSDLEKKVFFLENPEAKEYDKEISDMMKEHPTLTLDKAFLFAKTEYPKSKSVEDFSTASAIPAKDINDMTKEEVFKSYKAGKITRSEYLSYNRDKGLIRK